MVPRSFPINANGITIPAKKSCGINANEEIETACLGNAEERYNAK